MASPPSPVVFGPVETPELFIKKWRLKLNIHLNSFPMWDFGHQAALDRMPGWCIAAYDFVIALIEQAKAQDIVFSSKPGTDNPAMMAKAMQDVVNTTVNKHIDHGRWEITPYSLQMNILLDKVTIGTVEGVWKDSPAKDPATEWKMDTEADKLAAEEKIRFCRREVLRHSTN